MSEELDLVVLPAGFDWVGGHRRVLTSTVSSQAFSCDGAWMAELNSVARHCQESIFILNLYLQSEAFAFSCNVL
ncbi:unnamed protein product [Urochloa humidicola]